MDVRTAARGSLAVIRLVNGAAALVTPQVMARRLGADPGQPALVYVLRMFGVRTVVIGARLLFPADADELDRELRTGTLIHASDALAAACAGREGLLPRRMAAAATAISTVNVALTLVARGWPCRLPDVR
ncbi:MULTISPECIES: hypothetical protein [Streptomyces]|uniref:Uncharacterized protein n=1 Tax=Streptomyces flaveolus TaxID=67297 RepID=A0ABV3A140_9ACTN|nr:MULTISPECIES: hypothetical protein [Streptomyces]KMS92496.1 hypothetical protein ACZ91_04155 [Streptomyces regensis]KOG70810.1 hypothetical protein ADK77_11680 [Streptomyces antibioticus]KOV74095.1 hypothetical protein ADL02_38135 [Streptomyces sp. NRRL WC-3723]MBG7704439.1 hypothetical protein [Streptomyces sp. MC1]